MKVPRKKDALMMETKPFHSEEESHFKEDIDDNKQSKVSEELAQWLFETWNQSNSTIGPEKSSSRQYLKKIYQINLIS